MSKRSAQRARGRKKTKPWPRSLYPRMIDIVHDANIRLDALQELCDGESRRPTRAEVLTALGALLDPIA